MGLPLAHFERFFCLSDIKTEKEKPFRPLPNCVSGQDSIHIEHPLKEKASARCGCGWIGYCCGRSRLALDIFSPLWIHVLDFPSPVTCSPLLKLGDYWSRNLKRTTGLVPSFLETHFPTENVHFGLHCLVWVFLIFFSFFKFGPFDVTFLAKGV